MPHVRGHRNWWEQQPPQPPQPPRRNWWEGSLRETSFGRDPGRFWRQFPPAFAQIGRFLTDPRGPGLDPFSVSAPPRPAAQARTVGFGNIPPITNITTNITRDRFGNPITRTARDVSLEDLNSLMFDEQGRRTKVGEALGLLDLNTLSSDDLQNLVNKYVGELEEKLNPPSPQGIPWWVANQNRAEALRQFQMGQGQAPFENRADWLNRLTRGGSRPGTPFDTSPSGPLGGSPLTDLFGSFGLERQRRLTGEQMGVIGRLSQIDPDMAKELRDERNSFSAFGRRTVPDVGPYAGDLGRALWFENSALYQAAKRRIAEEPTPEEKEEKRLATRAGELRRRPPRFAAIRQV